VLSLLDKVEQIAKDTPPVDNAASRFGNPAFRTFYDKIAEVEISVRKGSCFIDKDSCRNHQNSMLRSPIFLQRAQWRSQPISTKHGEIAPVLTMGVAWN